METLPFWDTAKVGQLCRIPCYNVDEHGDLVQDCFNDALGTMTANGFRTHGGHLIDPRITWFVCKEHSGEGYAVFESA